MGSPRIGIVLPMSQSRPTLKKALIQNALNWFQSQFRSLVGPLESQFPNYALVPEVQAILSRMEEILQVAKAWPNDQIAAEQIESDLNGGDPNGILLLKEIVLLYRRYRAAEAERLTEKTFHLELVDTLQEDVKTLDRFVGDAWFQGLGLLRLPRLKDFLPVQLVESATVNQAPILPRQYDEKFHILQAPHLFLPDLAHFRAKCEDREASVAVAFLDIDHFKQFNTDHTEPKVDRNLLPRFMQSVEAHVFHHGYAYRQGGDEYLILIPSISRPIAIAFVDELRCKLADLRYPDIAGKTTVSVGLCIVEPDCPLTDRELRDRASQAKKFAKENGRNRFATYRGPRFLPEELQIVAPLGA